MTLGAVLLGVTGHAGLEALPGGLAVRDHEEALGIVEPAARELPAGHEPGLLVTIGAELLRAVTVTAGCLALVGSGRVPGEECGRMIP